MTHPFEFAVKAIAYYTARLNDARRFRDAKLNHAMTEGHYPVPQRPVFPPKTTDERN